MRKIILLNILFLNLIFSQQTPAPNQDKSVLIFGATAHIGNGEVIKNSLIGFSNGKIDLISVNGDVINLQEYMVNCHKCLICNQGELVPLEEDGILICNNIFLIKTVF